MPRWSAISALLLPLAACAADPKSGDSAAAGDTADADSGAPEPAEGQLALRFAIDADYAALMSEPPNGAFYGSFWLASEVSAVGPDPGAVDLGGIEVQGLTLDPLGGETAVMFTSGPLPSVDIVVLGFLDSDANSSEADRGPDAKDPVTLPAGNRFDVVGGETTEVRVFFGLLNPS